MNTIFWGIIFAGFLLEGSKCTAANGTEWITTAVPSGDVTPSVNETSDDIYNSSLIFNDTEFILPELYFIPEMPYLTLGRELTFQDVDAILEHDNAVVFLESFESDFERTVIFHQLRACPYIPLCGFSLNLTIPYGSESCCEQCACDYPNCLIVRTCCPDIIFQNENSRKKTESDGVMTLKTSAQKECIALNVPYGNEGAFGYGYCPTVTPTSDTGKCARVYDISVTSMTDIVPVMNKNTLDLYRNKYCAYCHGVNDSEFEYLQVDIKCGTGITMNDERDIMYAVLAEEKCSFNFHEDKLHYCSSSISRCNVTGLWQNYDQNFEKACNLYRSVMKPNEKFQNVFCSLCNGMEPQSASCPFKSYSREHYSFSGLLKMDSGASFEESELVKKCSRNQLYDKITHTCKEMFCSEIMRLHDGRCSALFEEIKGVAYMSYMRLVPTRALSIEDAYLLADDIIRFLEKNSSDLCGMQLVYQSDSDINRFGLSNVLKSRLMYFDARIQLSPRHFHDPVSYAVLVRSLHNTVLTLNTPFLTECKFSFRILVRDDDAFEYEMISNISKSDALNDGLAHPPDFSVPLPLPTLLQNYSLMSNLNLTRFPHLRINDMLCYEVDTVLEVLTLDPCPKVNISKRDVSWNVFDDGLVFKTGWYKIKSDDFYYIDDLTIAMCADVYTDFINEAFVDKISTETIVSVVCCSLSIICLLFTFIIFCIFPKLRRSVPGKNIMFMAFSLVCAQIMYLVGSLGGFEKASLECKIVGICVHFSWLVAMFWMNVCTYHMFRVLVKTKVISQRSGTGRIILYHLYTMIVAAIFVSINITVSHYFYGNVGYGSTVCYISSEIMIIFTFCIPISLVVLSNIGMFLSVVVAIKKSPSVQKNVQNERNDLVVFVKLSTITGATWIFGILNVWLNVSALSYIFILLNASQGVFLMFAFVVNRRVYGLIRQSEFGLAVTSDMGTSGGSFSKKA